MKQRVLLFTIAPPENVHGVRIVLHRHLVERDPFDFRVITLPNTQTAASVDLRLQYPWPIRKLRNSRFGPHFQKWVQDFECLLWCRTAHHQVLAMANEFHPDVVLFLADNSLSEVALRFAQAKGLPSAGLFLDWVPRMTGYFGHRWTCPKLDARFRRQYRQCNLAICTSDGMKEELGSHPNAHVIYPIGGKHFVPPKRRSQADKKIRLVYVGSVQNFYGRMLSGLVPKFLGHRDIELRIIGPNADWPSGVLDAARAQGIYLGFMPPEHAAYELSDADALLVVMSFEKEHELFMRTSFTTKFLDYCAFGKPIIVWGPEYCTPFRVAVRERGALVVGDASPDALIAAVHSIRDNPNLSHELASAASKLHSGLFNPDRLQNIFESQLRLLTASRQ